MYIGWPADAICGFQPVLSSCSAGYVVKLPMPGLHMNSASKYTDSSVFLGKIRKDYPRMRL